MGIENPVHLIFIGIVALLVLGPKRLPELARALGHGIREFREAVQHRASPCRSRPLNRRPPRRPCLSPRLPGSRNAHAAAQPVAAEAQPTQPHTVTTIDRLPRTTPSRSRRS